MDNSLTGISNPPSNQGFSNDSNPGLHVPAGGSNPTLHLVNQAPNAVSTSELQQQTPESAPVKRKPGRPKGSTKKHLGAEAPVPKIKRPVGRPRKDGLPPGSVGPQRTPRPPKHARTQGASPYSANHSAPVHIQWPAIFPPAGVTYPQANLSSASGTGNSPNFAIDPNLDRDDWADLARTRPNVFLATLLAALAAPNPVSSAGPSVEEAFKSHLVSLAPNPSQMQPIPSLYSILKTFWLPSSPSYFSLTASASTARTPSEHRFLYWDPQPLVFNGISCPSCSASLANKGRISTGPIKVYDIEKPFFIIGCEYVCKSPQCVAATSAEGRKFASTDSSILRSLPIKLKDEFPARLMYGDVDAGSGANIWNWKALGVSSSLWNMIQGCLRSGLKKDVILQLVHAIQQGIPEDHEHKEEEGEEGAIAQDLPPQSISAHTNDEGDPAPALDEQSNNTFTDAYSDAWKANTAVADPNGAGASEASPTQVTATQSTATQSTMAGPSTPSQPFITTYPSYPAAPYAFFPVTPGAGPSVSVPGVTTPGGTPSGVNPPQKRAYPFSQEGVPDSDPSAQEPQKRSPRHCCKCGSQECKGKGGRSFCMNACQDCGKLDCRGRNSRRPDKKCTEGWL